MLSLSTGTVQKLLPKQESVSESRKREYVSRDVNTFGDRRYIGLLSGGLAHPCMCSRCGAQMERESPGVMRCACGRVRFR